MKMKALTTHVYWNKTRNPGDEYELQYKHHANLLEALGRSKRIDSGEKKAPTKAPAKAKAKVPAKAKAKEKVPAEKGKYKTRDMKAE